MVRILVLISNALVLCSSRVFKEASKVKQPSRISKTTDMTLSQGPYWAMRPFDELQVVASGLTWFAAEVEAGKKDKYWLKD